MDNENKTTLSPVHGPRPNYYGPFANYHGAGLITTAQGFSEFPYFQKWENQVFQNFQILENPKNLDF